MSLKDFLWGTKKSWEYTYNEKTNKEQEQSVNREPRKIDPKEDLNNKFYEAARKGSLIGNDTQIEPRTERNNREFFEFKRPINKDTIVLVIENSVYTRSYKEKILQLAKKIIDLNKDNFFLLIRMGDDKKIHDVLSYDLIVKEQVLNNWFTEVKVQPCDYSEVITKINEYYISTIPDFEIKGTSEIENKKYSMQNFNIVFIGSGQMNLEKETKKECIELLKKVKRKTRVKSIKYFCILDKQTINVAKLGFPVIGHIETDFYE